MGACAGCSPDSKRRRLLAAPQLVALFAILQWVSVHAGRKRVRFSHDHGRQRYRIWYGGRQRTTREAVRHSPERRLDPVRAGIFQPSDDSTIGISSSAVALVDPLDLSLLTVYVGADDGKLYVLNSDGSVRWSFLSDAGKITSTPTLDSNSNVYVTTSNGLVSAFTFNGAPLSPFPVSVGAPPVETFQPSPGFGRQVFAIGAGGAVRHQAQSERLAVLRAALQRAHFAAVRGPRLPERRNVCAESDRRIVGASDPELQLQGQQRERYSRLHRRHAGHRLRRARSERHRVSVPTVLGGHERGLPHRQLQSDRRTATGRHVHRLDAPLHDQRRNDVHPG